jgi:hypothetical protein
VLTHESRSHDRGSSETLARKASASVSKRPLAKTDSHARFHHMPTAKVQRRSVKKEAFRLVRELPARSSWDDLMYRIYVRQKIEAGLADIESGRVHSHATIRKEFALP